MSSTTDGMVGFARPHRTRYRAAVAVGAAVALLVSACAGSSKETSNATSGSGGDATGIATAKSKVEANKEGTPFSVPPLTRKPPTGKNVAYVVCSLPACGGKSIAVPAKALGWNVKYFYFDLQVGPSSFASAVKGALASNPDYMAVGQVFPESIVADQIREAAAKNIPYISIAGKEIVPGITALTLSPEVFAAAAALGADLTLSLAGKPTEVLAPVDPSITGYQSALPGLKSEFEKLSPQTQVHVLNVSAGAPQTTTVAQTINYVRTHPSVEWIVYIAGSNLAAGVSAGLKTAGLSSKVKIICTQLTIPPDIDTVKRDWQGGVAVLGDYTWQAVDYLARLSIGQDPGSKTPPMPMRVVMPSTATVDSLNPPNYQAVYKEAWKVG